jgi:hypothetical protein
VGFNNILRFAIILPIVLMTNCISSLLGENYLNVSVKVSPNDRIAVPIIVNYSVVYSKDSIVKSKNSSFDAFETFSSIIKDKYSFKFGCELRPVYVIDSSDQYFFIKDIFYTPKSTSKSNFKFDTTMSKRLFGTKYVIPIIIENFITPYEIQNKRQHKKKMVQLFTVGQFTMTYSNSYFNISSVFIDNELARLLMMHTYNFKSEIGRFVIANSDVEDILKRHFDRYMDILSH